MTPLAFFLCLALAMILAAFTGKKLGKRLTVYNQAPPTTSGSAISLVVGEAVTDRYALMIRKDATSAELADAADDFPIGLTQNDIVNSDEVDAVPKAIYLLGIHPAPLLGIAGASITLDQQLVADLAAPGRVKPLPGTTGTYYVIGRAMNAASSGNPVLIHHHAVLKVAVA